MTAGLYGKIMFSFVRNCQTVFQSCILHSYQQWTRVPIAPHPHQHLVLSNVLDFSHSNRCIVVSHCFNLQFPNDICCWTSYHMLICHLYIFFGEMLIKVFGPFFNQIAHPLILSFKSFLYILDNSPLSSVSFANIFSQSVVCLLILLTLSFTEHRF